MIKRRFSKTAQVWIETVIYTLIGLTIIGLLLAVAKPKIDELRDKAVIEQSIESLNLINEKINEVAQSSIYNKRQAYVKISKGNFFVDMDNEEVYWEIDSQYKYSEPDLEIPVGRLNITTEKGNPWKVKIKIGYTAVNLTYNEKEGLKKFDTSPTPYNLYIENKGTTGTKINVDIYE